MTIRIAGLGAGGIPGLALLLGGCVAPAPAPVEVTVVVRGGGSCCGACNLVECHDRSAAIKEAYADPDKLHHTVPALDSSDYDRPRTVEHDRPGTVEHDRPGTVEHDRPGTVEHDRPSTVEHDLRDTVEHDLLRCRYRNRDLLRALQRCHQDLNKCRADASEDCEETYMACYHAVLDASP